MTKVIAGLALALAVAGAGFAAFQVRAGAGGTESAAVTTAPAIPVVTQPVPSTIALTPDEQTCQSWLEMRRTLAEGTVTPLAGLTKWGATAVKAGQSPALTDSAKLLWKGISNRDLVALGTATTELDAACA